MNVLQILAKLKNIDRNIEVWINLDDSINGQLMSNDKGILMAGTGIARGYPVKWLIAELMKLSPDEIVWAMNYDTGKMGMVEDMEVETIKMHANSRGYKVGEEIKMLMLK